MLEGEMTEEEFRRKVEEYRRKWRPGLSRDGFIEVWRKRFSYRGIPYEIALFRYFSLNDPEAKLNRIGKHAVLEYPDELEELARFIREWFGKDEWLFRDTLHPGQEDWDENMMIQQMHKEARECIDWLLDSSVNILRKKAEELEDLIEKAKAAGGGGRGRP